MSEKRFISEYVEIIDENGSRQAVCVTDKEHTVSFEVKDEYVAMELANVLNEQQATIRKLQDLCGKSDGENMKLRIENKRLCDEIKLLKPTNIEQYEQIQKLQEENEQLKNRLNKGL